VFLIPQLYNARRFEIDLSSFPLITGIEEKCRQVEAFEHARPGVQPNAV